MLRGLTQGAIPDGFKVISTSVEDMDEWIYELELKFRAPSGKVYLAYYKEGSNTHYSERPFEFDGNEYDCIEVEDEV